MNFLGLVLWLSELPCEAQGLALCTKDLNFKGDLPFDFLLYFPAGLIALLEHS